MMVPQHLYKVLLEAPIQSFVGFNKSFTQKHVTSNVQKEAEGLGLTYLAFGRWGKKNSYGKFQVTHVSHNGKLYPVEQDNPLNTKNYAYNGHYDDPENLVNKTIKQEEGIDVEHEFTKFGGEKYESYKPRYEGIRKSPEYDKLKKAFSCWQGGEYEDINRVLWAGTSDDLAQIHKKHINNLDEFFHKNELGKLHEDMVVYAGNHGKYSKGTEFAFKALMATSLDYRVADNFAKPKKPKHFSLPSLEETGTIFELHLKKGQKGVLINALLHNHDSSHYSEYEVLLPRGTQFKVTEDPVWIKNNLLLHKIEIIDQPEPEPIKLDDPNYSDYVHNWHKQVKELKKGEADYNYYKETLQKDYNFSDKDMKFIFDGDWEPPTGDAINMSQSAKYWKKVVDKSKEESTDQNNINYWKGIFQKGKQKTGKYSYAGDTLTDQEFEHIFGKENNTYTDILDSWKKTITNIKDSVSKGTISKADYKKVYNDFKEGKIGNFSKEDINYIFDNDIPEENHTPTEPKPFHSYSNKVDFVKDKAAWIKHSEGQAKYNAYKQNAIKHHNLTKEQIDQAFPEGEKKNIVLPVKSKNIDFNQTSNSDLGKESLEGKYLDTWKQSYKKGKEGNWQSWDGEKDFLNHIKNKYDKKTVDAIIDSDKGDEEDNESIESWKKAYHKTKEGSNNFYKSVEDLKDELTKTPHFNKKVKDAVADYIVNDEEKELEKKKSEAKPLANLKPKWIEAAKNTVADLQAKGEDEKIKALKDKLSNFEEPKTLKTIFGSTKSEKKPEPEISPEEQKKDEEWFDSIEKNLKGASPSKKKEMKDFYKLYHKEKFSKDKWKQLFGESIDLFKYNSDIKQTHHSSQAAIEAKGLGLTYLGFGRYGKRKSFGQGFEITHYVENGRLIPWDKYQADTYDNFYKADQAGPELDQKMKIASEEADGKEKQKALKHKVDDITKYVLQEYQDDKYMDINTLLWKGNYYSNLNDNEKENAEKSIEKMDNFFELSKLPILDEDRIVYHGTAMSLAKDGEYEFKGYLSTTTHVEIATGFINYLDTIREPVLIQFNLKKGQKALYINAITKGSNEGNPEEYEYLLPRGTKFRIIGSHIQGTKAKIWQAEIIDQPTPPKRKIPEVKPNK
jgi:hypothetical protein